MRKGTGVHVTALAMSLALVANGCASSGAVTGSHGHDASKASATIPGWDVDSLKQGQRVSLWLRDGTRREGSYRGLADVPPAEYARRYARSREETGRDVPLPSLGQGLRVTDASGAERVFDLVGVESRGLRLRQGPRESTYLEFDRITRVVDSAGHTAEGAALARLAAAGKVPLLAEILLDEGGGAARVPLEAVGQVELKASKGGNGKTVAIVIAAVAAVGIVIALAAGGGSSPPPPSTTELRLCSPLVSSYDGERYVADSDVFGGAMHRRAKRTDWDTLDHLRESDARYRLRIEKTHAETEYVDELKLLAVDHPAGTLVLPDTDGTLHTFTAPQEPLRALVLGGDDVTALTAHRDDRAWVSSPFGRDPEVAEDVRDGLVVEFARPAGADSVRLALRVQNTSWAYYLRHRFLELLGRDFDRWYARMDSSAAEFGAFEAARLREVAMTARVWDGASWRHGGFVSDVGSALLRDVALAIDIRDVPGDRLRLRLDSTAGLWMIDSVQADFSAPTPLRVSEIPPSHAREERGGDVAAALLATDDRSYEMSDASKWAELVFDAPPRRPDLERTLVLKTNGYYRIHVHGEGEPQAALVLRLIREPGAFGQYSLRLLNEYERPFFAHGLAAGP